MCLRVGGGNFTQPQCLDKFKNSPKIQICVVYWLAFIMLPLFSQKPPLLGCLVHVSPQMLSWNTFIFSISARHARAWLSTLTTIHISNYIIPHHTLINIFIILYVKKITQSVKLHRAFKHCLPLCFRFYDLSLHLRSIIIIYTYHQSRNFHNKTFRYTFKTYVKFIQVKEKKVGYEGKSMLEVEVTWRLDWGAQELRCAPVW